MASKLSNGGHQKEGRIGEESVMGGGATRLDSVLTPRFSKPLRPRHPPPALPSPSSPHPPSPPRRSSPCRARWSTSAPRICRPHTPSSSDTRPYRALHPAVTYLCPS